MENKSNYQKTLERLREFTERLENDSEETKLKRTQFQHMIDQARGSTLQE